MTEDICFGFIYINPDSTKNHNDIPTMFDHVMEEVSHAHQTFKNVMLFGDFNAHIGKGDEFQYEHSELIARFPCLRCPRMTEGITKPEHINLAGRMLLDVASSCPLIITTGRGKGDNGQRTFKGYNENSHTRTDHAMMNGHLYENIIRITIDDDCCISDHNPIQVTFPLLEYPDPADHPPQTSTHLKWSPNQEPEYSKHICAHLVNHPIHSAIKNRDVDGANQALIDLI